MSEVAAVEAVLGQVVVHAAHVLVLVSATVCRTRCRPSGEVETGISGSSFSAAGSMRLAGMMLPGMGWFPLDGSTSCRVTPEKSPLRCAGVSTNAVVARGNIAELRSLVGAEEEEPVLDDRAADAAAKLVALEMVRHRREKVARVHRAVAQELEHRAVQLVRAGLGHDVDHGARRPAVLGAVVVGLDAELFERVRIGERIVDVRPGILIAGAVQKVVDAFAAGAVGGDRLRARDNRRCA